MKRIALGFVCLCLTAVFLLCFAGCTAEAEDGIATEDRITSAMETLIIGVPTTESEETVPETTVPDTTEPDTTGSDAADSETTAVETIEPEATESETTIPETDSPETSCAHSYEVVTTAATCTEKGKTVTTCSRCGDSKTETISAMGHDYKTTTTAATCTEDGKTVTTCSRCGDSKTETISAMGHDYKTTTTAATCTAEGNMVTTCSRCDHYETSVIPTMGHDLKTTVTTATCTEDGRSVTTCSRCDHYETSVLPATGHAYGEDHRCGGCDKQKPIEVIVLAGQSNAVGVGHSAYLSQHFDWREARRFRDGYENVRIRFYAHNQKNTALEPVRLGCAELNRDTFGPEVGMADYLTMNYPGREFVIVKCAFGSTTLYHDWAGPADRYQMAADGSTVRPVGGDFNREAGWCLDELYALLDETLRDLEEEGYEPTVRAFCWMQGEGDSLTSAHAAAYGGLYRRMLAAFDETYASYMSNCVYVDGGISTIWKYYREINAFKASFAAEAENRFYIDTIAEGLTTHNEPEGAPDIYHYDSDSVIKLGRLFAACIPIDGT